MKAVRPRLAVHAYARTLAARVPEASVERLGTRPWIEVHHEQAVFTVFT